MKNLITDFDFSCFISLKVLLMGFRSTSRPVSGYKLYLTRAASKLLKRMRKADMVTRNSGRALVWLLKVAITPLAVRSRVSDVKAILYFTRQCSYLARKSGIKFLVSYLKASQVLLQQSIGGYVVSDTRLLKVAVSRTRKGLPRIIPVLSRDRIRSMDVREIRLWMTLLGLYRVLGGPGTVSFDTITTPGKAIAGEDVVGFQRFIHTYFWNIAMAKWGKTPLSVQANFRNKRGKIPLFTDYMATLKAEMFPITKSSPVAGRERDPAAISTAGTALDLAAVRWRSKGNSYLWNRLCEWCRQTNSQWISDTLSRYPSNDLDENRRYLGRLALKEEAAGKVRVFAMVDAFTQWALYPLHMGIMREIGRWDTDGTFDQYAPVKALLAKKPSGLWSFDLSAATDRLPLQFQRIVLQPVLGIHGAEVWGDLLNKRGYFCQSSVYHYAVGQPMGAYSSWAMLALTHHALVQWAWFITCQRRGRPYTWFSLYAVLGDDVIIGHAEVAAAYLEIMATLGVKIGLEKSLVSPNKLVGEFAKRFFIPREASMIPIKGVIAARFSLAETLELIRKYSLTISQVLSFAGFGYKVKGSVNNRFSKLGSRARNLLLMASHPSVTARPWSDWLRLQGWNRLGPALSNEAAHSVVEYKRDLLLARIGGPIAKDRKTVWTMMMVKRDHGNRYNPFDYLYDRYEMVVQKLDGYTYEISEIEKTLKATEGVSLSWEVLPDLFNLERRLDNLPKPDDFESRPEEYFLIPPLSDIRLWRKAQVAGQNANGWKEKSK